MNPPPIIDCAVVLAFAVHDDSVEYSGRATTYHNGDLVGPEITNSAICKNLTEPNDYLFFYCVTDWNVQAAVGHETVEKAEEYAVRCYPGIERLLTRISYSEAEIEEALIGFWSGCKCSVCGKWPHEVNNMTKQSDEWYCEACT